MEKQKKPIIIKPLDKDNIRFLKGDLEYIQTSEKDFVELKLDSIDYGLFAKSHLDTISENDFIIFIKKDMNTIEFYRLNNNIQNSNCTERFLFIRFFDIYRDLESKKFIMRASNNSSSITARFITGYKNVMFMEYVYESKPDISEYIEEYLKKDCVEILKTALSDRCSGRSFDESKYNEMFSESLKRTIEDILIPEYDTDWCSDIMKNIMDG